MDILTSNDSLLLAVVRQLRSPEPIHEVVQKAYLPQAEHMVFTLASVLNSQDTSRMLRSLYDRTPAYDKFIFIERCVNARARLHSDCDELASLAVADAITSRASDVSAAAGLTSAEQEILRITAGRRSTRWLEIEGYSDSFRRRPVELIDYVTSIFADATSAERTAVAEIALDIGIFLSRSAEQIAELAVNSEKLWAIHGEVLARRLLVGAMRSFQRDQSSAAPAAVMSYVTSLFESGAIQYQEGDVIGGTKLRWLLDEVARIMPTVASDTAAHESHRGKVIEMVNHMVKILLRSNLVRRSLSAPASDKSTESTGDRP
jgi:hypothetical protein